MASLKKSGKKKRKEERGRIKPLENLENKSHWLAETDAAATSVTACTGHVLPPSSNRKAEELPVIASD